MKSKGDKISNKDIKNFLKEIITNDYVVLEDKFVKRKKVKLYFACLFFTNEAKFLEIEPNDRRYTVFLTGKPLRETKFLGFGGYDNLKDAIEAELEDFAKYLYNYEVDVDLANRVMDTPEKEAVINVTTSSYEKFLTALKNRNLDFFDSLLDSEETEHKILYSQIEEAFKEGKIKRALITKIFNVMFQKNITPQKLLEELKAIDLKFLDKKNLIKIKGCPYLLLP